MGPIDIIKPLSTVLGSAVKKSQEHQEKNSWGMPRIESGAAGCNSGMLPLCYFWCDLVVLRICHSLGVKPKAVFEAQTVPLCYAVPPPPPPSRLFKNEYEEMRTRILEFFPALVALKCCLKGLLFVLP